MHVDLLDPVLSLLDRQVDALADQPTMPEFLISVEPFLRALEADPRIAIHLEDLRDETLDRVRVIEKEDSELVPKLIELRARLVELSPDLDDSNAAPPSEGDDRDWIDSLAQFDVIAAAEPEPLNYKAEGARSQRLLEILRAKRERLPRPHAGEIEAWVVDLYNLSEVWAHATRWLALSMRVSAGLALLRLDSVPPSLNPEPTIRKVGEKRTDQLNAALQRQFSVNGLFFNALHTDAQADLAEKQVAELRAGLTRLSVELHRRIGVTRSRRALILRFKQRCEWHDATRLREVAESSGRGQTRAANASPPSRTRPR